MTEQKEENETSPQPKCCVFCQDYRFSYVELFVKDQQVFHIRCVKCGEGYRVSRPKGGL